MILKRLFKAGIIILLSVGLLLAIGLSLLKIFGPTYLIPYVIEQVDHKTNGRYSLTVSSDSLNISFIDMSVRLGKTEFKRDTTSEAYSQIEFLDKFDVDARFESFNIKTFNLIRYILSNRIVVDEISMIRPVITVRKNSDYDPDNVNYNKEMDTTAVQSIKITPADSLMADSAAWNEFKLTGSKHLPHLKVKVFELADADFSFYGRKGSKPIHELRGLTLDIVGFQLLRKSDFAIEDINIEIDYVSSLVGKSTARLMVNGARLRPREFHIDSLYYGHIVGKYNINRIKGFRASWLDILVKDINLVGLHPKRLVNDSTIIVDKVSVGDVKLNLFKDKEELKINPSYKPLPQENIRNLGSQIMIDTIELLNANLVIDMQAPAAHKPGQISFNNTQVFITNISNIKEELSKNADMHMHIASSIMNKIPLALEYNLKLNSVDDEFTAICKAQPFNVTELNGFIGSQFFIEFASGQIDEFQFSFEGNNKVNVGQMDLEYTDLKVRKLNDYEQYLDARPKTGFIAGVGNIIIPTNRSKQQKGYKQAAIYYEKEYNLDIIHGTIMSMLSGIMSSVGLSSKNLDKKREKAESLTEDNLEKSAEEAKKKADKVDEKKAKQMSKEISKEEKDSDEDN